MCQDGWTAWIKILQPNPPPEKLLMEWRSRAELAEELGLAVDTLARWEAHRIGPPCIHVGRSVFYRRGAVQDRMLEQESRKMRSTARASR